MKVNISKPCMVLFVVNVVKRNRRGWFGGMNIFTAIPFYIDLPVVLDLFIVWNSLKIIVCFKIYFKYTIQENKQS
jgi:hypothetical protein